MTTTGSSGSVSCARRNSASPSMPSIFRSVTTIPGKPALSLAAAEPASSCTISSKPASSSHCVTAWRIGASSSTKRTGTRSGMSSSLREHGLGHQARKLDHQLGAAFCTINRIDTTAEVLDDAVGDRKAETQPLADGLRCNERIEDLLDQLGRDARSVVGNDDTHAFGRPGRRYFECRALHIGYRIERVTDQIHQHLFELHRVARNPEIAIDIAGYPHAGRLDLTLGEEQRALDSAANLDRLRPSRLALARERFQVTGDLRHALGKAVDQVDIFRDLPGIFALQVDLRAGHKGAHGGERLVHLMRDGGRHLPECRKLAR